MWCMLWSYWNVYSFWSCTDLHITTDDNLYGAGGMYEDVVANKGIDHLLGILWLWILCYCFRSTSRSTASHPSHPRQQSSESSSIAMRQHCIAEQINVNHLNLRHCRVMLDFLTCQFGGFCCSVTIEQRVFLGRNDVDSLSLHLQQKERYWQTKYPKYIVYVTCWKVWQRGE